MRLRDIAPYGVVLATAAVLVTQVDRFPDVFPVHWGWDGQPNGFLRKRRRRRRESGSRPSPGQRHERALVPLQSPKILNQPSARA
jgi:hypothetical protein